MSVYYVRAVCVCVRACCKHMPTWLGIQCQQFVFFFPFSLEERESIQKITLSKRTRRKNYFSEKRISLIMKERKKKKKGEKRKRMVAAMRYEAGRQAGWQAGRHELRAYLCLISHFVCKSEDIGEVGGTAR